jgi:AI-2 transport protein TqsA
MPTDPPRRVRPGALRDAAHWVLIAAGAWWLLGELAVVLRPLLLAVFLGYVLLPYHSRLRKHLPAPVSVGLLAGATTVLLVGLVGAVYASVLGLADELPRISGRVSEIAAGLRKWAGELPYVGSAVREALAVPDDRLAGRIGSALGTVVNAAASGLIEAVAAGLYLLLLLLEAHRLPDRVRDAYPPDRAEQILDVFGRINAAIIGYLKAKVKSSLVLAVPAGVVLAGAGVRFALLWAVLTFLCNFIPYVGTAVALLLPLGFAAVQLGLGWTLAVVAILLIGLHAASAAVVEPTILGRAVGLSPVVILAALSVWGTLWGLPGMFLAVPLTVVLKLVFENVAATRPAARLLGG